MLIKDNLKTLTTLSQAESVVADNILELKNEISEMSIRELASYCYTSTSAITRLCNKLGFKGYKDFKVAFLKENEYLDNHFNEIDANFPFSKDDNLARVCHSILQLYQETSQDTLSLIDYQDLIKATTLLNRADYIYVVCIGVGLDLAKIFADKMMRIGKTVIVNENQNVQYYYTCQAKKSDCFILISYTGTTFKTRQFFDNIINSPASSILITSVGENYLSKEVDVVLNMTTREKLYSNIAPFSSTISIMLILDLLYSSVFHKNYDRSLNMKKQLALKYEPNRHSSNEIMNED